MINIYEKSSRIVKIQNLNVFSSKRFTKIDIMSANKICSFSIAKSIFLIFKCFSNFDHVFFFRVFVRRLYENFNQINRF